MARKFKPFKPDLVIAGSGITAPTAILAARAATAHSLCFVYRLDLVVGSFIYQKLFVPAIRRCDTVISINQNTSRLARIAGMRSERIRLLHPGAELPGNYRQPDVVSFKKRFGLETNNILLSVGRLSQCKGMAEFIKSHINPFRDGARFLLITFKVGTLYSPLKLFLPISLAFFATGLTYYLYTYLILGRLTNMSVLLLSTSVLVFLTGLVSEQITNLLHSGSRKN